ncbi:hypothetical protein ONA91_11245 [Micromonospora sp. DR5-3]|nr:MULTISPECIES: hypothetical protein [unclassified Micromonospora]MCW3815032.1 hypothetical protein [Micromonospora sp. DR5-3]
MEHNHPTRRLSSRVPVEGDPTGWFERLYAEAEPLGGPGDGL